MEMTHGKEVTQSERTCTCFLRKRYLVARLSFLGFANIYAMRVNLSMAIAVMVANQTVIKDGKEIQVLSNDSVFSHIFLKTFFFCALKPLKRASLFFT